MSCEHCRTNRSLHSTELYWECDKANGCSEDSDDDVNDEILGFTSLLNLTKEKCTQSAEQIKELIKSFCETCEKSMTEQLDKLLNDTTDPVDFQVKGSLRFSTDCPAHAYISNFSKKP